jgi:hypothetical protein
MAGQRLAGCDRGNGDGRSTPAKGGERFCDCHVCRARRWMDSKIMRGQLAPVQEETVRELIRHLGGDC